MQRTNGETLLITIQTNSGSVRKSFHFQDKYILNFATTAKDLYIGQRIRTEKGSSEPPIHSIEAFCLRMLRGALLMRKTAGMRWAEKQCNGDLREKSVVG